MQNSHNPHQAADIPGIGGKLGDRVGRGFNEQAIDFFLMQARKLPQLLRQREDHMIIRYRQEFLLPPLEPGLGVGFMAFGATAVTTGMIGIMLPTALVAFKYMATHGGSAASEYVLERTSVAW
jgi:hypothetical protein